MKSLFKNDSTLTEEGAKLQLQLDTYFKDIFNKFKSNGFNIREIPQLIYSSSSLTEALFSIKVSDEVEVENKKNKREQALKSRELASKSKDSK